MRDVVELDSSIGDTFTPSMFGATFGLSPSTTRRHLQKGMADGSITKLGVGVYMYTADMKTVTREDPQVYASPPPEPTRLTVHGFICQQQLGWAEGCAVERICVHMCANDIHKAIHCLQSVLEHTYGEQP